MTEQLWELVVGYVWMAKKERWAEAVLVGKGKRPAIRCNRRDSLSEQGKMNRVWEVCECSAVLDDKTTVAQWTTHSLIEAFGQSSGERPPVVKSGLSVEGYTFAYHLLRKGEDPGEIEEPEDKTGERAVEVVGEAR